MNEACDFTTYCMDISSNCVDGVCDCMTNVGYKKSKKHPTECIETNDKDNWVGDKCTTDRDCVTRSR